MWHTPCLFLLLVIACCWIVVLLFTFIDQYFLSSFFHVGLKNRLGIGLGTFTTSLGRTSLHYNNVLQPHSTSMFYFVLFCFFLIPLLSLSSFFFFFFFFFCFVCVCVFPLLFCFVSFLFPPLYICNFFL